MITSFLSTLRLLWGMTREGILVGSVVGTVIGMTVGVLLMGSIWVAKLGEEPNLGYGLFWLTLISGVVMGAFNGWLIGSGSGLIVGGLNGVGMALMTRLFFYPLLDLPRYERWMQRLGALITGGTTWLLLAQRGFEDFELFPEMVLLLDMNALEWYHTMLRPLLGGTGGWLEVMYHLAARLPYAQLAGLVALGMALCGAWASGFIVRWYERTI